jgi:hypothetical protein
MTAGNSPAREPRLAGGSRKAAMAVQQFCSKSGGHMKASTSSTRNPSHEAMLEAVQGKSITWAEVPSILKDKLERFRECFGFETAAIDNILSQIREDRIGATCQGRQKFFCFAVTPDMGTGSALINVSFGARYWHFDRTGKMVNSGGNTLHERLEALVNQFPDIESAIESNPSLRDLLNSIGEGVPLVEQLKNPSAVTLAPWAGIFIGEDRSIGVALNYGFVLGLRFAYEEQNRPTR